MYKRILIPTDGSRLSERAIKEGVKLAKATGARVAGFTSTPPYRVVSLDPHQLRNTPEQYKRDSRRIADKALAAVERAAKAAGVPCTTSHAIADRPHEAIIRAARRKGCDLIFMASHGHKGVTRFLLGSETTKVVTHSKIPVLVCR
jgi:nucleotide-binding universal stress UspA family protein